MEYRTNCDPEYERDALQDWMELGGKVGIERLRLANMVDHMKTNLSTT